MALTYLFQNSAEGGTNGVAVTPGNSGGASGTAFTLVPSATPSTVTFDNSWSLNGGLSIAFTQGTSTTLPLVYIDFGTAVTDIEFLIPFMASAAPAVPSTVIARFFSDLYVTNVLDVAYTSTRKWTAQDPVANVSTTSGSATTAGTGYVMEGSYSQATNLLAITIYPIGDPTTVVASASQTVATDVAVRSMRLGIGTANSNIQFNVDDIAFATGGTTIPRTDIVGGPTAVIAAAATGVDAVAFDGTGSSAVSPATVATYAWTFGDGTTSSGSTPSKTYSAPGTYTVTLVVKDSNGTPSTADTYQVMLAAASGIAAVAPFTPAAGITVTPPTTEPQTVLNDTDPTSLITIPSASTQDIILEPIIYTGGQPVTVTLLMDRVSLPTSGTLVAKLVDGVGGTVRSTQSGIAVAIGSGASVTNYVTVVFPAVDCAGMSQWLVPVLRLTPTGS